MNSNPFERFCLILFFVIAVCVPVAALAQDEDEDGEEKKRSRVSTVERLSKQVDEFEELFVPVISSVADSTVAVIGEHKNGRRKRLVYGTIVDSDGFILTKASELNGEIECELPNGDKLKATVYGIDYDTDLALLKVDATGLPAVVWNERTTPVTGQWLVSPDSGGEAVGIGVVGVDARKIPRTRAFVGIQPTASEGNEGALILSVIDGTPAKRAGLKDGDIIARIDDVEIDGPAKLRETLSQYEPEDSITLLVKRGDSELEIVLNLADETNVNPSFDRSNAQNSMGSTLSRRRQNFPNAVQHDSQLQANECGGPIVDLEGSVVGVNIARSGRVFSLFLPAETVLPVLEQLRSGDLSPAKVNEPKIALYKERLKESATMVRKLPAEKLKLEEKIEIDRGRREELTRLIESFQERIDELDQQASKDRIKQRELRKQLKYAEESTDRLKEDLRRLQEGS